MDVGNLFHEANLQCIEVLAYRGVNIQEVQLRN